MATEEAKQLEKIPVEIFPTAREACLHLSSEIRELIEYRQQEGRNAVLGLATGSTPVGLYRELIRMHREDGLSFQNVITFNLDEYYGLEAKHPESYARFMADQLFDHVDLDPDHCHVPNGMVDRKDVHAYCLDYEKKIQEAGGIDIQILGIGRTGHIGFNEPGSTPQSRTRLVTLDTLTRRDAARDFLGEENVPRYAITMGVGTILEAKKVVLLAWGENKSSALYQAVEEMPNPALPASFLQNHEQCRFLVDTNAAGELTRIKYPWKVSSIEWTDQRIRQAVVWLARQVEKPILKLTEENYSENSLSELITEQGPAYDLNIRIFNETQHTITGWPGGKPNADDSHRPERASPHPKRVVVFSPEPGNAVTGMGGTINRLVKQGHEVTVCFLTTGNLGVEDEDALQFLRFSSEFIDSVGDQKSQSSSVREMETIREELADKGPFDLDNTDIRAIKGLIRKGEAISALKTGGLPEANVAFLDLPFYNRGRYRRFAPKQDDQEKVTQFLKDHTPHSVFLTGSKSDPSSLQAICFNLLKEAFRKLTDAPWIEDCRIWVYPGETTLLEPHEIDMSVPLSPSELTLKVRSIYQHQSQRSQSPSLNEEYGDIWQIIGMRNQRMAVVYDKLGLAEYEAMEVFQRWR